MNTKIVFSFDVDTDNNPLMDNLIIDFYPRVLEITPNRHDLDWDGAETPFKTRASIMLKKDVDPRLVTQDFVLKINVTRTESIDKLGILQGLPEYITKDKEEYIKKEKELYPDLEPFFYRSPIMIPLYYLQTRFIVFFMNLPYPNVDDWVDSTVEVLVKVNIMSSLSSIINILALLI